MKKILASSVVVLSLVLAACGGGKKDSAASIAQKWCDLNGKVAKAEGDAKDAAKAARKEYEESMEKKYGKDEAFMKEIGQEVEKCEDASEGK